jgi:lysophospholipase L1-like esterase
MSLRFAFLLVAALALGCGGSDTPTSPTNPGGGSGGSGGGGTISGPTIACPANVASGTTGTTAQVAFPAPSVSGGSPPVTVSCAPSSGSTFPLGSTSVSCTASDALNRQAACAFTVNVTRIPTLQRTRFLAFGDSTTAGEVSVPTATGTSLEGFPSFKLVVVPAASYPTQLQALLRTRYITQQTAITVANSGVPGETAVNGARRFPGVMSSVRPEVVLLLEGYNDLALGLNFASTAAAAVESMAKEARNRGARVYIASLTPPRAGGKNSLPVDWVTNLNGRLRSVAAGENAVFVDLYQALVSNVTTYIGSDGLHPTEVGYQRIAETFAAAIQATLQNP